MSKDEDRFDCWVLLHRRGPSDVWQWWGVYMTQAKAEQARQLRTVEYPSMLWRTAHLVEEVDANSRK